MNSYFLKNDVSILRINFFHPNTTIMNILMGARGPKMKQTPPHNEKRKREGGKENGLEFAIKILHSVQIC